jgi:hypothetical protein
VDVAAQVDLQSQLVARIWHGLSEVTSSPHLSLGLGLELLRLTCNPSDLLGAGLQLLRLTCNLDWSLGLVWSCQG